MIEIHEVIEIYKTKKADFIPFLATFIVSLWFGLEFGILAGIAINVLMTLYITSRPTIVYEVEKVNEDEEENSSHTFMENFSHDQKK